MGRSGRGCLRLGCVHTIAILEVFPNGGVLEVTDHGIRSIPVARQVRLFYRIDGDRLIILEFIDTRSERFQQLKG